MARRAFFLTVLVAAVAYFVYEPISFDPDSLRGSRVLVTGASVGIGRELVLQYCSLGAKLLVTSRSKDKLDKLAEECASRGGEARVLAADMCDSLTPHALHKAMLEHYEGIDQLVLNHMYVRKDDPLGMYLWGDPRNLSFVQDMYNVNVLRYVQLATLFLPQLKRSQGGVTISNSQSGIIPTPRTAAYAGTKHALTGFFEAWAMELDIQQQNVAITICYLGLIGTERIQARTAQLSIRLYNLLGGGASVHDTASSMIRASNQRKRRMYYPRSGRGLQLFYHLAPDFVTSRVMGFLLSGSD